MAEMLSTLSLGGVAQCRFLDGADQRTPGHHLVAFGDAVFDHYLQIRHRQAYALYQLHEAGAVQRMADE
ncbi:hypothetical protein GY12_09200 [Micrococcus luteus]|nr:hypothetical protein GY12_09200 [Micrococcus luteus]